MKHYLAPLAILLALAPVPAAAELVVFTSGRTMSVRTVRYAGDLIVLELRDGGEIAFDRTLVARIDPDEVPWPSAHAVARGGTAPAGLRARPYADLLARAAERHGVDLRLLHAVVEVESAYRADARSPKGAMGLMQLMPATARQYGVGDPYDPASNIDAGTRHLRGLLERFETTLALAAYNAGEAAVERYGGIPPFPETRGYVARILRLLGESGATD